MSIKTVYVCDKCGDKQEGEVPLPREMFEVILFVDSLQKYPIPIGSREVRERALWCRKCVIGVFGIKLERSHNDPEPPTLQPTIEDLIRNIIQEEIDESIG